MSEGALVAGADIWKGRWVVVVLLDGRFSAAFVAPTVADALERLPDVDVLGVDIPVGLPGPGQRRPADDLARKVVGPRWASVFSTPSQDMLEAVSYGEARRLGSITAQAYGLARHILAVQPVARADPRVHEVHPEVSFATANGGRPLAWSKTTWNGLNQRRRILAAQGIRIPDELSAAGVAGVADVLDAAAVAWSAARIAARRAERIPAGRGRIGAIWY